MYKVLGSCSICGGNVVIPLVWMGIYPPTPYCNSCGAVREEEKKIIKMKPVKRF